MNGLKRLFGGMSRRTLALTLALVVSLATATGGTLAWLVDQTASVTNTFTYGDVNITLTETASGIDDDDNDPNTNTYKMMPGKAITKDPKVTVLAKTEDCYVFVKIDKSENFDSFMTYEVAEGWTALEGETGVYYREVAATDVADAELVFPVLTNDTVQVKSTVTTEMLRELDQNAEGTRNYPTLTFTAYAVQRDAEIVSISTPAAAWATATTPTGG